MLVIVGEPIVAYQRDLAGATGTAAELVAFDGPWPSGSPAIAAYVAGCLGVPTTFVGAVGDDANGEVMRAGLARGGVDVSHLHRRNLPTGTGYVTYADGSDGPRSFRFDVVDSAAPDLHPADLGELPERATWIHLSGSSLLFGDPLGSTALVAVARAKASGCRVSVDVNARVELLSDAGREQLVDAVAMADVLLPSTGELDSLGLSPQDLAARGVVVCVTAGAEGLDLFDAAGATHIPAVVVDAVDTDGAGDSFAAGFIAASLAGSSPPAAARFGARVAAEAITVRGPMSARFDDLAGELAGPSR